MRHGAVRLAMLRARMFVVVLGFATATAWASMVSAQTPATREVHGALDAFSGEGVTLAWAIQRGKDESATRVVVRVEADPALYGAVSVVAVDPFTRASVLALPARSLAGPFLFVAPRAGFADHPRTEWRFHREPDPAPGAAPTLLIYFQGIPDTAPEFDEALRLDAYLVDRVARARAERGRATK